MTDDELVSRRAKIDAFLSVARNRPRFTVGIVALGVVAGLRIGTQPYR